MICTDTCSADASPATSVNAATAIGMDRISRFLPTAFPLDLVLGCGCTE